MTARLHSNGGGGPNETCAYCLDIMEEIKAMSHDQTASIKHMTEALSEQWDGVVSVMRERERREDRTNWLLIIVCGLLMCSWVAREFGIDALIKTAAIAKASN